MNCNTPSDIVFSFQGFSQRGGATDHHSDGWGIAFFEEQTARVFIDSSPSIDSALADFVRQTPIQSLNIIAHVRKATLGDVSLKNCHPFVREMWGQHWVFAHNGTLLDYAPPYKGIYYPVGTTDSERAFCAILEALREHFPNARPDSPPSLTDIDLALQSIVRNTAQFGKFNFCLSNGQSLWAYCSTDLYYALRQHPFSTAQLTDIDVSIDFTQRGKQGDCAAIIATLPLTNDEHWHQMATGELIRFKHGTPQSVAMIA